MTSKGRVSIVFPVLVVCKVMLLAGSATAAPVFFTDFESGVPAEFSDVTVAVGTQGYAGFGFGGTFLRNTTASSTLLTLGNLPAHTALGISFDLAIIDSWDGSTFIGGAAPSDFFNVRLNGVTVFSATFDNFFQSDQTAPTVNTITFGAQLGFTGTLPGAIFLEDGTRIDGPIAYVDSAYNMGHPAAGLSNIPHSGNAAIIEFFASGSGWQGGNDESWAIDNLSVTLVPDPSARSRTGRPYPYSPWDCRNGASSTSLAVVGRERYTFSLHRSAFRSCRCHP